ncbi:MAG: UDP-glucose--hexose-1-phosphate uridylyltransferase [Anaerolineaceae bacterium]|nr:UDP-glucose--hexose-1-phosphate uridylyltransferase [Anaerolineaceae bacterium]
MTFTSPHRRYNPLNGDWVLVSPHRAQRPWLGAVERSVLEEVPTYDPQCYLCPGNQRANGIHNPQYGSTFVFNNDFSALLPPTPGEIPSVAINGPFNAVTEAGVCRVVCFSPSHNLTLPELNQSAVEKVVRTWTDQVRELNALDYISYVQVFENRGEMMGASNPHPHSQIWASQSIPNEVEKELQMQARYQNEHGVCLLCTYLAAEKERGERIVAANDQFTALVPYWAVWPFELLVISHRHYGSFVEMDGDETAGLADILRQVTTRYDNLFTTSFPYSMGFHQLPGRGGPFPQMHFHAHYYPPLLRSASVRKFMVGYELLAQPQRDITPESAAERLRELSSVHYKA